MGKRKRSHLDESDYRSIRKKVKKLERKLQKFKRPSSSSSSDSDHSYREGSPYREVNYDEEDNSRDVQDTRT